jgi:hypothetical protein
MGLLVGPGKKLVGLLGLFGCGKKEVGLLWANLALQRYIFYSCLVELCSSYVVHILACCITTFTHARIVIVTPFMVRSAHYSLRTSFA